MPSYSAYVREYAQQDSNALDNSSDKPSILTGHGETGGAPLDSELRFVVQHWANLDESTKQRILQIVRRGS